MYKKLLIVLLSLSLTIAVFALDDQGNPNDPNENDRANACYEGGSMAGKCLTDWDWEAGWYFIRFEYGLISREDFPEQYAILLPPVPGASNNQTYVGCQPVLGSYLNFGSSQYAPVGSQLYMDAGCTNPVTPSGTTGTAFVWASSLTEAESICAAHGHPSSAGTVNPGQLYHCN